MVVYLALVVLIVCVIGLSCYQTSQEDKINKLEDRIKKIERIGNRAD